MAELKYDKNGRLLFTKEMKKEYTVLVPDMLPIHFNIMRNIFLNEGYKVALLDNSGRAGQAAGSEIHPQRYLLPRAAGHGPVP